LDGLKQINDTAGHIAGDMALAMIGKVLRSAIRTTDLAGRYGGDEFLILLPDTPLENINIVIERINEGLNGQTVETNSGVIPIKCSFGVCGVAAPQFEADNIPGPIPNSYFQEMEQLLIAGADQTLYQSKQNGGSDIFIENSVQWLDFREA
jgi:diguanylate cyclase (GGDEF)-like protein